MATASLQIASQTEKGSPHPLGATPDRQGVNFSLFSSSATAVELLLFKRHDDPKPYQTIQLDPNVNKTFHFWHVYVKGVSPGTHYAYRVDGPRSPNTRSVRKQNGLLRQRARGKTPVGFEPQ